MAGHRRAALQSWRGGQTEGEKAASLPGEGEDWAKPQAERGGGESRGRGAWQKCLSAGRRSAVNQSHRKSPRRSEQGPGGWGSA